MAQDRKPYVTPVGRVTWNYVYDGKENQSGVLERKLTLIFDNPADLAGLVELYKQAVADKWGTNPPKNLRSPFKSNRDVEWEGAENPAGFHVEFKDRFGQPQVIDRNGEFLTKESGRFYSGCFAKVSTTTYAYDKKPGVAMQPGVSFNLCNVQKWEDGPPLVAVRTDAADDFGVQTFEGSEAAGDFYDPLGGESTPDAF